MLSSGVLRHLKDVIHDGRKPGFLIEIELLVLSFSTGIQDATSFPDYCCFASNQTGNTVFLAVAAAGLEGGSFNTQNIGVSLGVFLASCFIKIICSTAMIDCCTYMSGNVYDEPKIVHSKILHRFE